MQQPSQQATVYGAYGHTGRFVVDELRRRGWTVVLSGRDAAPLQALADALDGEVRVRVAAIDAPAALDQALAGSVAVLNCAGPFMDTADPLIAAALRAGAHYLDACAEQGAALRTFAQDARARAAGILLLPAAAFFGGVAELLASALLDDGAQAERIDVAVALDHWFPTRGTRLTGQRNTAARLVVRAGRLVPQDDPAERRPWSFPAPFGELPVVGLPLAETITLHHHLPARIVQSWMTLAPLAELRDPATPGPVPSDARGRSAQRFAVDVQLTHAGGTRRRAVASGRDIYAVSAPLMVTALEHAMRTPRGSGGAYSLGQRFASRAFLAALAPDIAVQWYAEA